MKLMLVLVLFYHINLVQTLSHSSIFPFLPACTDFSNILNLVLSKCDYSDQGGLSATCVKKEDNALWNFADSTIYAPITANNCAIEANLQEQNGKAYHSSYNISRVGVRLETKSNTYQLFTESTVSAFNSCRFAVHITADANGAGPCHSYKHYSLVSTAQSYFTARFEDQCLQLLKPDTVYDVSITDSSTDSSSIYRFFTPSQLFEDDQLPSPSTPWQTLVAVSLHYNTITVHTQPVPALSSASYLLRLTYTKGDEVQLEESVDRWLTTERDWVSFESPGALPYTVEVLECKKRATRDDSSPTEAHECRSVQRHSFRASEIYTDELEATELPMESSSVGTGEIAVEKEPESLRKEDLYILIGTVFGVVIVVLAVLAILLMYLRRRHSLAHGPSARFSGGGVHCDNALLEEDAKGYPPSILLIYSYDCLEHLACVQALAMLLQNTFGCSVIADFWATEEIAERGIYLWLQHKMATVNYVMVVCSTGARFKSVANRRARLEQTTDDAYLMAMRLLHSQADTKACQKVVVYFDYSSESEIPVLFENWQRYKLPQDIKLLVSEVVDECPKDKEFDDLQKDIHKLSSVQALKEKVNRTKIFMLANPDWFHQNMQSSRLHEPTAAPLPQPLPVVTVEHNGERQQTGDWSRHKLDTLSKFKEQRAVSPSLTLNRMSPLSTTPDAHSNGGSFSSSLEDLEHDIDFILHPSLPRRADFAAPFANCDRFFTSSQAILPTVHSTSNGCGLLMVPQPLTQIKSIDVGHMPSMSSVVCQEG